VEEWSYPSLSFFPPQTYQFAHWPFLKMFASTVLYLLMKTRTVSRRLSEGGAEGFEFD
jgi:hypothetical protein